MSKEQPTRGKTGEQIEIVYELPPSAQGTYQYEREDGTIVHGDASGEWTLDENGEVRTSFSSLPALDGLRAEGRVAAHPPLARCSGVGACWRGRASFDPVPQAGSVASHRHRVLVSAVEHDSEHCQDRGEAVQAAHRTFGYVEHNQTDERNHRKDHRRPHLGGASPPMVPEAHPGHHRHVMETAMTSNACTGY